MREEGFCGRIFCACVLVRCGIGGTRTPKIKREKHWGLGGEGEGGGGFLWPNFLCMCVGSFWNWWDKNTKNLREKHWGLGWGRRGRRVFMAEFFVHVCWFVVELVGKKTHQILKEKNIAGWDGWGGGGRVLVTEFFCACMLVRCGIVGKCISVGKLDDNLF